MMTEFTWKWKNQIFVYPKDIQIFKDNVLFGIIPTLRPNKSVATINGQKFFITETSTLLSTQTFIIDPESKKKLAEIKYHNTQIILEVNKKHTYDISIGTDDNPVQSNGLIVQLYKDKIFFAKNGKIEIRNAENIELLLLSTFYAYYLRKIDSNN